MNDSGLLLILLEKDQENIRFYKEKKVDIDEYNKTRKEIDNEFQKYLEDYGFPFKNTEGEEIYKATVILGLHAGQDFLEKIYEIIKDAGADKVDAKDKAYFIDRLLVYKDKPQIYGTQFKRSDDGSLELFPVEDPENLNKRRAEVGLEPMSDYLKKFN